MGAAESQPVQCRISRTESERSENSKNHIAHSARLACRVELRNALALRDLQGFEPGGDCSEALERDDRIPHCAVGRGQGTINFMLHESWTEAQKRYEDALSRSAIVSATNVSRQEELNTAKKRKKECSTRAHNCVTQIVHAVYSADLSALKSEPKPWRWQRPSSSSRSSPLRHPAAKRETLPR